MSPLEVLAVEGNGHHPQSEAPVSRCSKRRPRRTRGDKSAADEPLEAARTELGRALVLLRRLQEHNPGSPALAELRNHLEGAWRLIGEKNDSRKGADGGWK